MMKNDIFSIKSETDFLDICIDNFRYQAKNCEPYGELIKLLNININDINKIDKIPFLPIELFKSKKVYCSDNEEDIVFLSSSTTGTGQSFHYVEDISLYEKSFTEAFRLFYGEPNNYAVLGLLPSYLERAGSSLIYMVNSLIHQSNNSYSGFFLDNYDNLHSTLCALREAKTPTILIGVTYALLDFVEKYTIDFPDLIVMETGGMKGKRKEISRVELHKQLCKGFCVQNVHSEYSMTELLSQAYSKGDGKFSCPPWMKILIRDIYDPFKFLQQNISGGINIIDLANLNSCSFIATQDIGKMRKSNEFEVLGRFSTSDIRGCNLLVQ